MPEDQKSAPRAFISYSWTSPTHESWVLSLASRLRQDGVDAILDKWDLQPGNDAYKFMEQMVTDASVTKVIMVCDRKYCEKADKREGGVGAECQIISPELYGKAIQGKFAAVITEMDESGKATVPVFYKGRIYFDFTSDEAYETQYEELLRWVYERPARIKPALGTAPSHIIGDTELVIATESCFRRTIDAIRAGSPTSLGHLREYTDKLITDFEKLRLVYDGSVEMDDLVLKSIATARPYVEQVIALTSSIARYSRGKDEFECILKLFERLAPFMERPEHISFWRETDFDNFKYLCHEIFLSAFAILLREERFDLAQRQVACAYLVNRNSAARATSSYSLFSVYLKSLEIRNVRLKLQRVSVHADELSSAYSGRSPNFIDMMQADFVLYLREVMRAMATGEYNFWNPITLVYSTDRDRPFEIFGRSESSAYFSKVAPVLGASSIEEFKKLMGELQKSRDYLPQYGWHRLPVLSLANVKNLGVLT